MLNTNREDFTWEPNNEEEAELAQLQALFENEAAVRAARDAIRAQSQGPSAEECDECGEPIPEARRVAIPGVRFCVDCKELAERRR